MILSVLNPSVEMHPSTTVASDESLHWHVRSDIEWSVDVETEFFIESFSFTLSSLVKIDDIPFLVNLTCVLSDNNLSSFLILGTIDIKNLLILSDVDELSCLELEDLEPL